MKKYSISLFMVLSMAVMGADTYQAPNIKLKNYHHKHDYQVIKESDYRGFKVHEYKVDEKPIRKRDVASKKNGGRLPSSDTVNYHEEKVHPWPWEK